MAKFHGVDIGKELNKGLGSGMSDAVFQYTLVKRTPGTRGTQATAGTNPTETNHTCRGLADRYSEGAIDGTRIKAGDRKFLILAASISPTAVPAKGDKLIAEGTTWHIEKVDRDPVEATYTCQGRGRG